MEEELFNLERTQLDIEGEKYMVSSNTFKICEVGETPLEALDQALLSLKVLLMHKLNIEAPATPIRQEERESAEDGQSIYENRDMDEHITSLSDAEVLEKVIDKVSQFGDGLCEFETREIEQIWRIATVKSQQLNSLEEEYASQSEPKQRRYTEEDMSKLKSELKRIEQYSDIGDDRMAIWQMKSIATDILQSLNK